MHHWSVLPGQHVWGRAGEHGGVRVELHPPGAEWKAPGPAPSVLTRAQRCFGLFANSYKQGCFFEYIFFFLVVSDSAARLPHEDSAQLSPHEEDDQRKQHTYQELRGSWIQRECSLLSATSRASDATRSLGSLNLHVSFTWVLFFNVESTSENDHHTFDTAFCIWRMPSFFNT